MNPKIITELDVVPIVPIEQCWSHLSITPNDDSPPSTPQDDLILAMLSAAREWVEGYTGLALTPRTLELALDEFPSEEIRLPIAPLVSVVSVKYLDGDAIEQTIADTDYVMDDYQRPGWLLPASGTTWPTALDVVNAVTIRYNVGYNLWSDSTPQRNPLPKALRSAVLLILGSLFENRENESEVRVESVPTGAKSLCDWYRIRIGMA